MPLYFATREYDRDDEKEDKDKDGHKNADEDRAAIKQKIISLLENWGKPEQQMEV